MLRGFAIRGNRVILPEKILQGDGSLIESIHFLEEIGFNLKYCPPLTSCDNAIREGTYQGVLPDGWHLLTNGNDTSFMKMKDEFSVFYMFGDSCEFSVEYPTENGFPRITVGKAKYIEEMNPPVLA